MDLIHLFLFLHLFVVFVCCVMIIVRIFIHIWFWKISFHKSYCKDASIFVNNIANIAYISINPRNVFKGPRIQNITIKFTAFIYLFILYLDSYQSPRPLSLRLFLVSLVMSGAAGHDVWLTLTSEDPPPTLAFSCDRALSSREGVWLSLASDSTVAPTGPSAPPSSRGNKLRHRQFG